MSQQSASQIEIGALGNVVVTSSWCDTRKDDNGGCSPSGCVPSNVRDGSTNPASRWSCKQGKVEGGCTLTFDFGSPEFVTTVKIAFYEGDQQRTEFVVYGENGGTNATAEHEAWIFTSRQGITLQSFPVWSSSAYQNLTLADFTSDIGSERADITEVEIFVTANGKAATTPTTLGPTPTPTGDTLAQTQAQASIWKETSQPAFTTPTPTRSPASTVDLATPSPSKALTWGANMHDNSSTSTTSDSEDPPPNRFVTAISVSALTGLLGLLGLVVVTIAAIAELKRRKRVVAMAKDGASGFPTPSVLGMCSPREGASTFGISAWELNSDLASASSSEGDSHQFVNDLVPKYYRTHYQQRIVSGSSSTLIRSHSTGSASAV